MHHHWSYIPGETATVGHYQFVTLALVVQPVFTEHLSSTEESCEPENYGIKDYCPASKWSVLREEVLGTTGAPRLFRGMKWIVIAESWGQRVMGVPNYASGALGGAMKCPEVDCDGRYSTPWLC